MRNPHFFNQPPPQFYPDEGPSYDEPNWMDSVYNRNDFILKNNLSSSDVFFLIYSPGMRAWRVLNLMVTMDPHPLFQFLKLRLCPRLLEKEIPSHPKKG